MADIHDLRAGFKELAQEIGPRAVFYVTVNLLDFGAAYSCGLYAYGMSSHKTELNFRVEADDLPGLVIAAREKWASYSAKHEATTIRKMALAIIRITAELGECTDAALRNCDEFDPAQVARFGDRACIEANEIAGKGPFSIIRGHSANVPFEAA